MRNLALKNFESRRLDFLKNCEIFCVTHSTLFAYDRGTITKYDGNNEDIVCDLTDGLYPGQDTVPKAVEFVYHYEKNQLYLILSNGDIVSAETERTGSETVEGCVENGVKAAQWSPEQEVVAIVNGIDNVIILTSDFDPVNEVNLHGGGLGEKQNVSVGWGSKETQFHGSAGKSAAKAKPEEVKPAKDDTVRISWRGDAEYFAVMTVNPENKFRYLRIFSKNGVLQYTSEPLSGLEGCLNWRPSGNLIATTQILPNKYNVCFFEKNGLKHGDFSLAINHTCCAVIEVSWSKDSRVLAVFIIDRSKYSSDKNDTAIVNKYILLYTVSNYKWYCKYKISFDDFESPLCIKWDYQILNSIHIISSKRNNIYYYKYTWTWVTNKSPVSDNKDESLVAVIDGCDVNLTSFKRGIIPPPMCSYKITATCQVNSISFAPDSTNNLLLHLSSGDILIFKFISSKQINHELVGTLKSINSETKKYYNCQWINSNKFLLNSNSDIDGVGKPHISVIHIKEMSSNIKYEKENLSLGLNAAIVKVSHCGIVIYDNSGKFYLFKENNLTEIESSQNKNILEFDVFEKETSLLIFSLDSHSKFYINSKLLFSNILSFHVHDKFILLTNMKHELLCLDADNDLMKIDSLSEVSKRRVERGSRLITSIHKDMKVILQMPRGNLECIQPRALSMYTVGKYLDSMKYAEAFDLMRKQRINLNLIYDHDPDKFLKNSISFIEQINDPQWISLFISDLIEEDVTETMYKMSYRKKTRQNVTSVKKSKIENVCDLMEKTLSSIDNAEEYILPILTCHIKRNNIELFEKALLILKNLKEREDRNDKPLVSFNEAFRYVLYLLDVEELYKIALGMYDFDLVLAIAQKSHKDPKEYLPFLNELKNLESHYRKYKIDKHLKRYEKALRNIVLCEGDDRFNECLNFIIAHQLYKTALKLIPRNTDRYKRVCLCYGEHLMKSSMYEEAGIMFSNAAMYRNAIAAYRKSGNWHEVLNCANELEFDGKELNGLYLEVAGDLIESKDFFKASIIYLDYLKDVEESVKTLANGKLFAEAYRIAYLHKAPDLIPKIVVPAIVHQSNLTAMQIAEFRDAFEKQCKRLQVVRKKKAEEGDSAADCGLDSDVYSESSTVITRSKGTSKGTSRTYRSAKNKRKQERKLLSLKEGSPYEHLALVVSLHGLVTSSFALMPEVKEMNKFLVKINEYEMAEKLQKDYDEFLKIIAEAKCQIWIPELLNTNRQSFGPDVTSNEIASAYLKSENANQSLLEPKYAIPPEIPNNLKWKLEIVKS